MKGIKLMAQIYDTIPKPKNNRLIKEDCVIIQYMLKNNKSQSDIAKELGVNRSTISREIKKGTVDLRTTKGKIIKVYLADYAQTITDNNKGNVGRKPNSFNAWLF